MTTRPRISSTGNWVAGIAAVGLFAVMAAVFLTATIPAPTGFEEGSITASIGYAMFNLVELADHTSEPFLVAFLLIAVVLDAALDGSVMLAKREEESDVATDGGRSGNTGGRN